MKTVNVVDYDPKWSATFQSLCAPLHRALEGLAHTIEHVGSTSIPGLAAKPTIDMDVVVSRADVAPVGERLLALGYESLGDLGVPDREAFRPPPDAPHHNLYVCPSDSLALANHRAIRDHLRGDPAAARRYGELKKRLAREHSNDIDAYVEAKTAFLVGILRKVGFAEDALTDIVRINRRDGTEAGRGRR